MADANDLTPTIQDAATGPQSATGDAGSVTARTMGDLVTGDRYLKQAAASKTKRRGLRFSKVVPAGNPADQQGTGLPSRTFDGGIS